MGLAPRRGIAYGSPGECSFLRAAHGPFLTVPPLGIWIPNPWERASGGANPCWRIRFIPTQVGRGNDLEQMDAFTQQAFGVLSLHASGTPSILTRRPKIRTLRQGDPKNVGDGAPRNNEHFLLARRLVEAGARVVTLNFGRWDFHSNNTAGVKGHAPIFDQGLSALIEDLSERGLSDDVAVVAWGEFGRTPVINKNGGRDHWPQVGCAFVAGGKMNHGQMIGATDRKWPNR